MKLGLRFFIPLIGISAISAAVPAADMLSVSGHARTSLGYVDNQGGQDADATERWLNRVRLNLDVTPSKSLMVRLTPELAHSFGAAGTISNPAAAALSAREAWMSWQATDLIKFYMGRQTLNYGNGLVISSNDGDQGTVLASGAASVPTFFDAVRAQASFDLGKVDFIYAKVSETALSSVTALKDPADTDLYGVYAMLNPDMGAVKNVDLYAVWYDNRASAGAGDRYAVLGLRADGQVAVLDYNAEIKTNFGKTGGSDKTVKGFTGDLTVGANVMNDHHAALAFTYANTEARAPAASDGRSLGRTDIITRQNLIAFALNTDWKLHEKWGAYIDGFYFLAAKDNAALPGLTRAKNGRNIGFEGNFGLSYKAEKNLTIEAGYDVFKATDVATASKTLSSLSLTGTLTF